jgi:hypothetical protein
MEAAEVAVLEGIVMQQGFQYPQELRTPSLLARAVLDKQIVPALLAAMAQTLFLAA